MVPSDFHFQFITVYNATIDFCYTLIGHFRALYQMYFSSGVDIGRDGSPNHQQIDMS